MKTPSVETRTARRSSVDAKAILESVTTIAIVAVSLAVMVKLVGIRQEAAGTSRTGDTIDITTISVRDAPLLGSNRAPFALVMFSDFECPFCARFARDVLPIVRERYVDSGKVLLVYKHFPLEDIHPNARQAGQLAACAAERGAFWQAHDLLTGLESVSDASPQLITSRLPISSLALSRCMATTSVATIDRDLLEGQRLGVTGTPTFFLGKLQDGVVYADLRIGGLRSEAEFSKIFEGRLSRQR